MLGESSFVSQAAVSKIAQSHPKPTGSRKRPYLTRCRTTSKIEATVRAKIGTAKAFHRRDCHQSPFKRATIARVPPVVGQGKPVNALNSESGISPCASHHAFQAT